MVVEGAERRFLVSLPPGYDGTVPYPLMFGFHGKTRTHVDCRDTDCRGLQENFGERAIIVYMKSLNAGWLDENLGAAKNTPFFDATLETMKKEYCIDEHRVVLSGTSSGAFFSNYLACHDGDRLLAVFPVGGRLEEPENCQRPIPALVLHGIDDSHVTFDKGEATRDFYRTRNGCSDQTQPALADVRAAVRTERDARKERSYRCGDYGGCRAGLPVRWCVHGEGGYDDSTHAWPTFGGKLLREFLESL
jgi:poly(3-hydroxybutyrate) depolymerase